MRSFDSVNDQVKYTTTARGIRTPAFKVISRLQGSTPGDQIIGTAVALLAMCNATGLGMRRVIGMAERVMDDADSPYHFEIGAINDYAKDEIRRVEI